MTLDECADRLSKLDVLGTNARFRTVRIPEHKELKWGELLGENAMPADNSARVTRAKKLLADGKTYSQGCSGFISDVLQIAWQSANDLVGANTNSIGKDGKYHDVIAGDICGWVSAGPHGHVCIYVGEPGMTFIDVREDGAVPRKLSSYGAQEVYKSTKY